MMKLSPKVKTELAWIEIGSGVRVQVKPIGVADVLIARAAAGVEMRKDDTREGLNLHGYAALVRSIAVQNIVAWEGVVTDDDAQTPLPVTPENVEAFMGFVAAHDALNEKYVGPALSVLDAEKKD